MICFVLKSNAGRSINFEHFFDLLAASKNAARSPVELKASDCLSRPARYLKQTPCSNPLTSLYGISSVGIGVSVGAGVRVKTGVWVGPIASVASCWGVAGWLFEVERTVICEESVMGVIVSAGKGIAVLTASRLQLIAASAGTIQANFRMTRS